MQPTILENYHRVLNIINKFQHKVTLIVVSKSFSINHIQPLLDAGHVHFGENRVQESVQKWTPLLNIKKNLKIHLLGKLQTNKVVETIHLFSYVHSLDSEKLALKISKEQKNFNKNLNYFVQINLGEETQKSGISKQDVIGFINFCTKELNLNVIGLMCLPPISEDPKIHFQNLKKIAHELNLSNLSMGMSGDFEEALRYGSNFLRIGSLILGERKIIS